MEHPAGFEPATSRVTDEVTAIFTDLRCAAAEAALRSSQERRRAANGSRSYGRQATDREKQIRWGTGDAVAALKGWAELRHFSRRALNPATSAQARRSNEVTDIFTTIAPPMRKRACLPHGLDEIEAGERSRPNALAGAALPLSYENACALSRGVEPPTREVTVVFTTNHDARLRRATLKTDAGERSRLYCPFGR